MRHEIYESESAFHEALGERILAALKSDGLLTLPSGDTPQAAYAYVVEKFHKQPFSIEATIVGLDEWIGMDKTTIGGCQYAMHNDLFDHLPIPDGQLIEFNALAEDLQAECEKMDAFLKDKTFSLVVLGIGMNGHLGLNEPGVAFDLRSHIVSLDEKTKQVAQKYFTNPTKLEQGITLGIAQFLEAETLLLIANHERKKAIIERICKEEVSPMLPASVAKKHKNAILMMDAECAYRGKEDE